MRTALSAINLSSIIANDDINTDWHQWKDTFLVAVSLSMTQKYINKLSLRKMLRTYKLTCLLAS